MMALIYCQENPIKKCSGNSLHLLQESIEKQMKALLLIIAFTTKQNNCNFGVFGIKCF